MSGRLPDRLATNASSATMAAAAATHHQPKPNSKANSISPSTQTDAHIQTFGIPKPLCLPCCLGSSVDFALACVGDDSATMSRFRLQH